MLILTLDYDTGWDWANYTYQGFWMPAGFVRNLFFNGWHPVVPRLGFLLFGIALGRLRLDEARIQSRLILFGALAFVAAQTASWFLLPRLSALSPDLAALATTAPVPPMPLFTLAGMGASIFVIGTCLRLSEWLERVGLLRAARHSHFMSPTYLSAWALWKQRGCWASNRLARPCLRRLFSACLQRFTPCCGRPDSNEGR